MKNKLIFRLALATVLMLIAGNAAEAQSLCLKPAPEDAAVVIREVYRKVLEREADDSGLITFSSQLADKNGYCLWKINGEIAASPEYFDRFIKNQTARQAIVLLYRHFLLREPESEQAINQHLSDLNAKGWQAKIRDIAMSGEAVNAWEAYARKIIADNAAPKKLGVKSLTDKGCKFFLGRENDYLCRTQESFDLCEKLKKDGKSSIVRCRLAGVNEEVDKALVAQGCKRIGVGQYSCVGQKGFDACNAFLKNKKVTVCKQ